MARYKFEIKKLYRKKAILFIIFFSFAISLFNIKYITSDKHFRAFQYIVNDPAAFPYKIIDREINQRKINENHEDQLEVLVSETETLKQKWEEIRILYTEWRELGKDNSGEYINSYYDYLLYLKNVLDRYDIPLTKEEKIDLEWSLLSSKYHIHNDIVYEEPRTSKSARIFLEYGTNLLFGIVPLVVILFLVLESLPKEYEEGTIITQYTQPKMRNTIIFSKQLAALSLVLIYIISTWFFTIILSKLMGYRIGSLRAPLRIYGSKYYITVIDYLLISSLAFLALNFFFISIVLLLGSITKNSNQVKIILIFLLVIGNIITSNVGVMQVVRNPFFLFDYRKILLGEVKILPVAGTQMMLEQIDGIGFSPYCYIILYGIGATLLTLITRDYIKTNKMEEKSTNYLLSKLNNNLSLEIRKILEGNSLKFSLFLTFILIGLFFLQIVIKDTNSINNFFGSGGPLHVMQSVLEFEKDQIATLEKLSESKSITEDERKDLLDRLYMYKDSLPVTKEEVKRQEDIYNSYIKGNSKLYYSLLDWDVDFAFLKGEGMSGGFGTFTEFEEGAPSNFSYIVTKERLKEFKKRDIPPFIGVNMEITSYDKFVDRFSEKWYIDHKTIKNHSGLFTLYRLFKDYNLDFILLGLILLFFLSGYTLEKELGNHLSLLYVQPCQRIDYYYHKIMASTLLGFIFISIMYILVLIMGVITDGLGQWRFPILEYTKVVPDPMVLGEDFKEYYRFMDLGNYIIRTIIVMIFAIGFLASLSVFTSLFINNRLKLFSLNLGICALGYGIVTRDFIPSIIKTYLPFGYLNVSAVADGSIKLILNNNNVNILVSILVLSIWIIGFYLLSKDAIEKVEIY